MADWNTLISTWKQRFNIMTYAPAKDDLLELAVDQIGSLNEDLLTLYKVTNGITYDWFRILPIEDPLHIKRTWDSISRANSSKEKSYFGENKLLASRFLVFAKLDGSNFGAFERESGKIWYYESDALNETNLTLDQFIDTCLKEVAEL